MGQFAISYKLRSHVKQYAESHRTPVNKLLHFLGIPALLVASLGLLSKLSLGSDVELPVLRPNAAWIALVAAGVWYVWQDWRLAPVTLAALVGCFVVGSMLSAVVMACLIVVGIAAHVIGHYGFEGKPPALLARPVAVLEAPAWLLTTWAGLGP